VSVKKVWNITPPSSLAPQLAHEIGLTHLQAQLLVNRGISEPTAAKSFLSPRLADIADPMLLKDMPDARGAIIKALEKHERITIYGDYDADGITATALLLNFFSSLRSPVSFYVPSRLEEGYGLNVKAVEKIAKGGTGLIITVDCGISNVDEIALAKGLGMEVVVTDHHQVPEGFQANCPVINPHRGGSPLLFKDLAGVGVAFFLTVAVRAGLREAGWFARPGWTEPDLKDYLDLVAIGTVADRVPLLNQNRILVNSGMMSMASSQWPGIRAMKESADITASKITTDDLAFRLAPRLNAPGRMGDSNMGVKILTVKAPHLAGDLSGRINAANIQRQNMEHHVLDEIAAMIGSRQGIESRRSIFIGSEGWHKGVLGIVASRLVDKYHRPSLVFTIQDGLAVGSGRSIDGFDLFQALNRLGHLFEKFGGHAGAAGFTLKASNIGRLKEEFEALARETLMDKDLVPTVDVDAEIALDEIVPKTVHQIMALSPFGEGNPEPVFCARSLEVLDSWIVGERHLKLRVRQGKKILEAIGFGMSYMHPLEGAAIDMIFTPELNRWQGYERTQLRINDLKVIP